MSASVIQLRALERELGIDKANLAVAMESNKVAGIEIERLKTATNCSQNGAAMGSQ